MTDPISTAATAKVRLGKGQRVAVWDLFVRCSHWVVVFACVIAWFSHGGLLTWHRFAGYVVGVLVLGRVIWGFVGTGHARFAAFVTGPKKVARFLFDMLRAREARYLGHNPAGGAMIVVLLGLLLIVSATGVAMDTPSWRDYRPLHDWHAAASDLLMWLALIHLLGVIYASFRHRENLIASMFSGKKRAERRRD